MIHSREGQNSANWNVPSTRSLAAPLARRLLRQRCHGDLGWIIDSERLPLRPIGTTAMDVAIRTGGLLAPIVAMPGVRMFRGVWSACARAPLITHVLTAGRSLLLIESVAWPPGRYSTEVDGRVLCDDIYIGQSVGTLVSATRYWRRILPGGHRVTALVVVHHSYSGRITLPETDSPDLRWVSAANAVSSIRKLIGSGHNVSGQALGFLIAATAQSV